LKNSLLKNRLLLYAKGLAMGAADVVPGVSGGTIAFITGIYQELLSSIASLNIEALKTLKAKGLKAFWQHINGNFFVVLLAGILTSIISFAHLIQFLLSDHPIPTWSFFFGLIAASVFVVGSSIKNKKSVGVWVALLVGTAIAYFITIATPAAGNESLPYIFLCGAIAIIAMILPGISGSFILLLMGAYLTVMEHISLFTGAIKTFDTGILVNSGILLMVLALGCVVGLLTFSRVLKWMFNRYFDLTIAVLTGFLIGSLNKVWPWKETMEVFVKHAGTAKEKVVPLVEKNILPATFEQINGVPSQIVLALVMAIAGAAIVLVLHRFSPKTEE
jgi:putative membrane protein